ncbi:MAG: alpha/beta fold hydrolase [Chitinophagaceae bacterium]
MIKVDPALKSQCGYLVVPENRQKPAGRTIKVPFVYLTKPGNEANKNVTMMTTGGPGYSTIANFDSIGASFPFFQFGGFLIFDQRGTKKSKPCLDCDEVKLATRKAYKEDLSKDSLELEAVKQCRKRLLAERIDLSAYNTLESAEDIHDLRRLLKIDSLTLFGMSYSGGLMLTVARNHPEGLKALVLCSPSPAYINYEEDALLNFNEALGQVFANCDKDSTNKGLYGNLRERFNSYFTNITNKTFTIRYAEQGSKDSLTIRYDKNELIDAIRGRMTRAQVKNVPFVISEIINGRHEQYVREVLDDAFAGDKLLSLGMRYSVYCTEQIAFADKARILQQEKVLPWFKGYGFNNVNHAIRDVWNVKPEPVVVKTPLYSTIPAFIASGDIDPDCSVFYSRLIKHYMPNAQVLVMRNQGHVPGVYVDGTDFLKMFMDNPYKKIVSPTKNVVVE